MRKASHHHFLKTKDPGPTGFKQFWVLGVLRETEYAPAFAIRCHSDSKPSRQLVGAAFVALADAQRLGPSLGAGSVRRRAWRSAGHALAPGAFATRVLGQ
jgi:hypothetical protein